MPAQNPEEEKHTVYHLTMRKGAERYVFVFDKASFNETSQTFRRFANDPNLSFSWHDATVFGEYLRRFRDSCENSEDKEQDK